MDVGPFLEFAFDHGSAFMQLDETQRKAIRAFKKRHGRLEQWEQHEEEKEAKATSNNGTWSGTRISSSAPSPTASLSTSASHAFLPDGLNTPTSPAAATVAASSTVAAAPRPVTELEVCGQELLAKIQSFSTRAPKWISYSKQSQREKEAIERWRKERMAMSSIVKPRPPSARALSMFDEIHPDGVHVRPIPLTTSAASGHSAAASDASVPALAAIRIDSVEDDPFYISLPPLFQPLQASARARRNLAQRMRRITELNRRQMAHQSRMAELKAHKEKMLEQKRRKEEEEEEKERQRLEDEASKAECDDVATAMHPSSSHRAPPFDFKSIFGISHALLPFESQLLRERYETFKMVQSQLRRDLEQQLRAHARAEARRRRRQWREWKQSLQEEDSEDDEEEETEEDEEKTDSEDSESSKSSVDEDNKPNDADSSTLASLLSSLAPLRSSSSDSGSDSLSDIQPRPTRVGHGVDHSSSDLIEIPPLESQLIPLPVPSKLEDLTTGNVRTVTMRGPDKPRRESTADDSAAESISTGIHPAALKPFHLQSDPNLESNGGGGDPTLQSARSRLRTHPRLLKLFEQFWKLFPDKDLRMGISRQQYLDFHVRMQKAVRKDLLNAQPEESSGAKARRRKSRGSRASVTLFNFTSVGNSKRTSRRLSSITNTPTMVVPTPPIDPPPISANHPEQSASTSSVAPPPLPTISTLSDLPPSLQPASLAPRSLFDVAEAERLALKDWSVDCRRDGATSSSMKFEPFCEALFELVDTWTDSTNLQEYFDFLTVMYQRIARGPGHSSSSSDASSSSFHARRSSSLMRTSIDGLSSASSSASSSNSNNNVVRFRSLKEIAFERLGVEDMWAKFIEKEKTKERDRIKALLQQQEERKRKEQEEEDQARADMEAKEETEREDAGRNDERGDHDQAIETSMASMKHPSQPSGRRASSSQRSSRRRRSSVVATAELAHRRASTSITQRPPLPLPTTEAKRSSSRRDGRHSVMDGAASPQRRSQETNERSALPPLHAPPATSHNLHRRRVSAAPTLLRPRRSAIAAHPIASISANQHVLRPHTADALPGEGDAVLQRIKEPDQMEEQTGKDPNAERKADASTSQGQNTEQGKANTSGSDFFLTQLDHVDEDPASSVTESASPITVPSTRKVGEADARIASDGTMHPVEESASSTVEDDNHTTRLNDSAQAISIMEDGQGDATRTGDDINGQRRQRHMRRQSEQLSASYMDEWRRRRALRARHSLAMHIVPFFVPEPPTPPPLPPATDDTQPVERSDKDGSAVGGSGGEILTEPGEQDVNEGSTRNSRERARPASGAESGKKASIVTKRRRRKKRRTSRNHAQGIRRPAHNRHSFAEQPVQIMVFGEDDPTSEDDAKRHPPPSPLPLPRSRSPDTPLRLQGRNATSSLATEPNADSGEEEIDEDSSRSTNEETLPSSSMQSEKCFDHAQPESGSPSPNATERTSTSRRFSLAPTISASLVSNFHSSTPDPLPPHLRPLRRRAAEASSDWISRLRSAHGYMPDLAVVEVVDDDGRLQLMDMDINHEMWQPPLQIRRRTIESPESKVDAQAEGASATAVPGISTSTAASTGSAMNASDAADSVGESDNAESVGSSSSGDEARATQGIPEPLAHPHDVSASVQHRQQGEHEAHQVDGATTQGAGKHLTSTRRSSPVILDITSHDVRSRKGSRPTHKRHDKKRRSRQTSSRHHHRDRAESAMIAAASVSMDVADRMARASRQSVSMSHPQSVEMSKSSPVDQLDQQRVLDGDVWQYIAREAAIRQFNSLQMIRRPTTFHTQLRINQSAARQPGLVITNSRNSKPATSTVDPDENAAGAYMQSSWSDYDQSMGLALLIAARQRISNPLMRAHAFRRQTKQMRDALAMHTSETSDKSRRQIHMRPMTSIDAGNDRNNSSAIVTDPHPARTSTAPGYDQLRSHAPIPPPSTIPSPSIERRPVPGMYPFPSPRGRFRHHATTRDMHMTPSPPPAALSRPSLPSDAAPNITATVTAHQRPSPTVPIHADENKRTAFATDNHLHRTMSARAESENETRIVVDMNAAPHDHKRVHNDNEKKTYNAEGTQPSVPRSNHDNQKMAAMTDKLNEHPDDVAAATLSPSHPLGASIYTSTSADGDLLRVPADVDSSQHRHPSQVRHDPTQTIESMHVAAHGEQSASRASLHEWSQIGNVSMPARATPAASTQSSESKSSKHVVSQTHGRDSDPDGSGKLQATRAMTLEPPLQFPPIHAQSRESPLPQMYREQAGHSTAPSIPSTSTATFAHPLVSFPFVHAQKPDDEWERKETINAGYRYPSGSLTARSRPNPINLGTLQSIESQSARFGHASVPRSRHPQSSFSSSQSPHTIGKWGHHALMRMRLARHARRSIERRTHATGANPYSRSRSLSRSRSISRSPSRTVSAAALPTELTRPYAMSVGGAPLPVRLPPKPLLESALCSTPHGHHHLHSHSPRLQHHLKHMARLWQQHEPLIRARMELENRYRTAAMEANVNSK